MRRVLVAVVALLLAGCSAAEPSAPPSPASSSQTASPTPTTKPTATPTQASAQDQFWTFVTSNSEYPESARSEGIDAGKSICGVLDESVKQDRSYDDTLASIDDRKDPDTEWLVRGAATYLCPAHQDAVDAWYATDPQPVYAPRKSDWQVKVKVREKQCFGSAGCNVTVKTTPSYVGDRDLPDEGTIEVTYKLTGDEAGAVTRSFTVEDGQISYTEEADLSTSGSGVKPKAKITDVSYSK